MGWFNSHFGSKAQAAIQDSKKHKAVVEQVIQLLDSRRLRIERPCLQFEEVNFQNPTPEHVTFLRVIEEILQQPRFSLVQWSGGPSLVYTDDVDTLDASMRAVNTNAHFIIRGGTDASQKLSDMAPILKSKIVR